MPISYDNAKDEMFGIINSVWASDTTAIAGYVPEIRWPGAPKGTPPDRAKFWARVSIQLVTDSQATLASNVNGARLYTAKGLLYMQLFCPRSVASPTVKGVSLAEVVRGAFRKPSPSGSIRFRDQVIRELPPTDESYPINVVVTFEYDTIQ